MQRALPSSRHPGSCPRVPGSYPIDDGGSAYSLPLVGLGLFLAEELHRLSAAYQFADAALQDLDNVPADIAPVHFTFLSHTGHLPAVSRPRLIRLTGSGPT